MKVELDRIFGDNYFRNEIIWSYKTGGASRRRFARKHDTILFYSKSAKYKFMPQKEKSYMMHKYGFKKSNFQEDELGQYSWVYMKDIWEIPSVGSATKERLGYPTQKPERLLERIIKASSNEGDVVADFFCGCGTALAVAQKLSRQWIGCDVSPTALRLVKQRLEKCGATDIEMVNVPKTLEELKAMKPFEFQNYVIDLIQGTHTPTLVGDRGIDGYTLFHHNPVQVKQQEHVGRPDIQKFESAIRQQKKTKGYFFALGFTKPAYDEVARANMEEGLEIELWQAQDLVALETPTFL
jgi:hypothetical protein